MLRQRSPHKKFIDNERWFYGWVDALEIALYAVGSKSAVIADYVPEKYPWFDEMRKKRERIVRIADYLKACDVANKTIESAKKMGKMSRDEFVKLTESMPLSDELKKRIIEEYER